jgi:Tol biopolymer transport system component
MTSRSEAKPSGSLAGRRVGDYDILELLGAGGMGQVYRARDDRLHRFVAIKALPETSGAESATRGRLLAEARAAAALTHPYICKVHEVVDHADHEFIVMELVAGETLRARLQRGRLPMKTALTIATEVAEALDHAHQQGVVHRDLKPPNIMIADGHVKILDFGLALSARLAAEDETETSPVGEVGALKGTLAYMSPEQLTGGTVDERTDVFALGIILYESLTGAHPFGGRGGLDRTAAILRSDPAPWPENEPIPVLVRHICRKALAKDPGDRYQTMHEVLTDLRAAVADLRSGDETRAVPAREPVTTRRRLVAAAVVVAGILLLAAVAYLATRSGTSSAEVRHTQITFVGDVEQADLSSDGRSIAYTRRDATGLTLLVRDLSGGPSAEIKRARRLVRPRWSPRGDELLYAAGDKSVFLFVTARLGGPERPVRTAVHGAWSADGRRLASAWSDSDQIEISTLDNQNPLVKVAIPEIQFIRALDWSPVADRLLVLEEDGTRNSIWTVAVDGSGARRLLVSAESLADARWAEGGAAIYSLRVRDDVMELVRVDPREVNPGPRVLLSGLPAGASLSIAGDGRSLTYVRRSTTSNLVRFDLTKPASPPGAVTSGTGHASQAAISPDGQWVAGVIARGSRHHIVKWPIGGGEPIALTSGDWIDASPRWSPDGQRILFASNRNGKQAAWVMSADGRGPQQLPVGPVGPNLMVDWFPNGAIAWQEARPGPQNFFSFRLRAPESNTTTWLTAEGSTGWVFNPVFSPAGDEVVVHWNRPTAGLYVVSWPGQAERLIRPGSLHPIGWSPDGQFIYAFERETSPDVWRVSRATGDATKVFSVPAGVVMDGHLNGNIIVVSAKVTQADVWRVENFRR